MEAVQLTNHQSVFTRNNNDQLKEPMFFGQRPNIPRYDQQKYEIFEKLTEKQISFFWRPEEIDVSRDRLDFQKLPDHEKHIFLSNLRYQILLDGVQGRAPDEMFKPICSLPELEGWITTWVFSETIHSRSYTHIIRNIVNNPDLVFNDIVVDPEILKRAATVSEHYDKLAEYNLLMEVYGPGKHIHNGEEIELTMYEWKKRLYLCMMSVNILEAIRFYVSFLCSWNFAERELMEGNAKIIKLIAR